MRRFLALALLAAACHRDVEPPAPVVAPTISACDAPSALTAIPTESSSSPLALARLGGRRVVLLADEDDGALRMIDLASGAILASAEVPVAHVVVGPNGRVHASLPQSDEVVELTVSGESLRECGRKKVPAEPIALALDDDALLVASRRGRALTVFRPGAEPRSIALSRDPEGVLVAGTRALVAHRSGSIVSVVALDQRVVAREVSFAWRDRIGLPSLGGRPIADMPRFSVQAHALARVNDRVLVPMVLAYPGDTHLEVTFTSGYGPSSVQGVDGYFPHEPALASLDAEGATPRLHVREQTFDVHAQRLSTGRVPYAEPCLLPRSIATDGGNSYVACLGIDRLVVVRDGREREHIPVAAGPIAVAVDHGEAIVWSQFARVLSVVRLSDRSVRGLPIAAERVVDPAWADGRRTFHAPIAFDGRACASCHPDGLDDGLVWSSPHGPMQPPVLAGRLENTAPYGWLGSAPTLQAHLASTMHRLGAKQMPAETMEKLIAYLRGMRPRARGELTALEKRGREVFTAAECGDCHANAGLGADGTRHDVGTGGSFDTPSLAAIARSAPYMHDGRFASLREVIVKTAGVTMGSKTIAAEDVDPLMAYLRTL